MESGQGTLREVAHPNFLTLDDMPKDPPEWEIEGVFSIGQTEGRRRVALMNSAEPIRAVKLTGAHCVVVNPYLSYFLAGS
jgi:hypothetical protein